MSRTNSFRSALFVWGLLSASVIVIMAFSHSMAMSAEKAVNDVEAKSYLPFVTDIGISVSDGPILISPENNAVLQTLIPTFVWNMGTPLEDNVIYCLTFSQNEDEIDGCWSSGGPSSGIVERIAWFNFEPDTIYFWRVGFIYDYDYDDIQWSETRTFTTGPSGGVILAPPTHNSPANGSIIPLSEAVLRWTDVAGAVEYSVLVHDVNEDRYYVWNIPNTWLNLSSMAWWGIEPGDNYEWSVQARNDYAWSDESEPWLFSILPSAIRYSEKDDSLSSLVFMNDGTTWVLKRD